MTVCPGTGVTATARITAAPDGRGGTTLPDLVSDGPLALRRTRAHGRHAEVTLVGAMSAPLGGDRLSLVTTVRPHAVLHITTAAATVALPGRTADPAHYDTTHTVGDGAELRWLPEPLISAHGCDLRMTTRVHLAATARLVLREEQILGRTGETSGRLTTRLTVHRDGRPLLDQELSYGPGVPGWDSGAVLAGHRAVGQFLLVDPALEKRPAAPRLLGETAVLTPLSGPALLITAVAPDALQLRRALDDLSASALS
ncbi:urease accessory protein UreD [Streptomyces gobiensis]|uniref:urease accessory protein UreD n=1 Tax=Streptomyces gobiensis TaxID=2875706 RepID=UPI001E2FA1C6|nr:urease accessory protein UreD [Streptomyces gobiensis]UGY94881.1 urease accessory protein UreD [Streptomyces gobiensis]